jgi:L-alanine-DL-glutamate epimerase-like enolase superfamily enzyme
LIFLVKVRDVQASPLEVPLKEPFAISLSTMTAITNVLVTVTLEDGTVGYGEAAPWPQLTGESQATVLATVREAAALLVGRDVREFRPLSALLKSHYSAQTSARAGVETAVMDALTNAAGIPLYRFLGGSQSGVETDLTIPIVPPSEAPRLARDVVARGIRTIKTKVGNDLDEDVARVVAIRDAAPEAKLILDANQAYAPKAALKFLDRLERKGITPILLEQPVDRHDLTGLKFVKERSAVPVAADEAVCDRHDALAVAAAGAADVVNVKLMKAGGVLELCDIAAICKAANIRLMIGGMMESRMAMNASAHVAAGLGGFEFIDLDTHMLLSEDPFEGGFRQDKGWLDLSHVERGTGVRPRVALRP